MSNQQQAVSEPTPQSIFELIRQQQQQLDKMMVLSRLMELTDVDITINGRKEKVLNQEMLTEYTNHNMTKYMVKIACYPDAIKHVFHLKDVNEVPLVPYMHQQIILKMKSHKRKGSQEIVNALRNEVAGAEVIPNNTKKKKFFGMM